jgi:hypothetical protein
MIKDLYIVVFLKGEEMVHHETFLASDEEDFGKNVEPRVFELKEKYNADNMTLHCYVNKTERKFFDNCKGWN